jgi:hypothetical protein
MLALLLPPRLDNAYHGSRIAPWLMGLVLLVKSLQSVMSIFAGATVAANADGVPLDSYGPAAAQTVIALFALLGAARLPFYALCVLALARYRSAIPLMLSLFALDYVVRTLSLYYLPIERTANTGGLVVNQVLFVVMLVALVLSLRRRGDAARDRAS